MSTKSFDIDEIVSLIELSYEHFPLLSINLYV